MVCKITSIAFHPFICNCSLVKSYFDIFCENLLFAYCMPHIEYLVTIIMRKFPQKKVFFV